MSKNYELELYKLINEGELVREFGWCSDSSCCAWINYRDLDNFMGRAMEIFGYGMFDNGGFDANMQGNGYALICAKCLGTI